MLGTPPACGDRIEIEGLSFADAYADPALRAEFEVYHDLLALTKDGEDALPWQGFALFILALACARAGYPLKSSPPPEEAAAIIRLRANHSLQPEYIEAFRTAPKQGYFGLMSPVFFGP